MANRIQMTHKAAELVLQQAPELKPHIAARRRQETTSAGVSGTVRTYWLDVYPVGSCCCATHVSTYLTAGRHQQSTDAGLRCCSKSTSPRNQAVH